MSHFLKKMLRVEKAFASMKAKGEHGQMPRMSVPVRPQQRCLQWKESNGNWNQKEVGNQEALVQSYALSMQGMPTKS